MVLLSGPNVSGNEWKYIKDCLDTGWVSSVGAYVDKFETESAKFTGSKYAVATSSGTTALHIALILAGVNNNDIVITQNITFVATLNSISYTGAEAILIDAEIEGWQMDLDLLELFLNANTEQRNGECFHIASGKRIPVIMPVHVLGNMCDMERLCAIANLHNITLIEDSTEALGSYYNGKHAGTFGAIGTLSYNGNKIITTGGGGMILTDNEQYAHRAKHLTTQAKSDPFEYFHNETGYNYRLTNIAAAMGVAQMEQLPVFLERKKEIINFYKSELENTGDIEFQKVLPQVNPNWWMPTIFTSQQKELLKILNEQKLQSRPFWVPMNRLPMYKDFMYVTKNDVSGILYDNCLSIPCSTYISDEELNRVAKTIKSIF